MFGRAKKSSPEVNSRIPLALWTTREWCNQNVAGESYRADEIRTLFGATVPRGVELRERAVLVPEPTNPHDPNAVAVHVRGVHVGYLPREDAARYAPTLRALDESGYVAETMCRVWGQTWESFEYDSRGNGRDVERFSASVTLALAEPHLCLPINQRPSEPAAELPHGQAIQIQGEEECMDAIAPVLRPEGSAMVWATAHEVAPETARGKPTVEIRIDGQRVGRLTPKMSGDLLPAVRALASHRHACIVRAMVEGNRLKAEVVVYAARAHQLPPEWPGELPEVAAGVATEAAPDRRNASPARHEPIPPKPSAITFTPPPGWPPAPSGWEPTPGWEPDPSWPSAPADWVYWVAR